MKSFIAGILIFFCKVLRTVRVAVFIGLAVGWAAHVDAAIVLQGSAYGINTALPENGTAGALTITRPAAAKPGMAMVVSIAARPSQMTWTSPSGWTQLSVAAEQLNGGTSTDPGGMTMKTFYKIVGLTEPTSYTWTFANTIGIASPYCTSPNPPSYSNCSAGGSAVGGMLVFSGLDTSSSPLDATPSSSLNASGTYRTTAITTNTANAVVVSMISYLSAGALTYSGTSCGTVEVLDRSAPATANAIGTTLQMGYFTKATPGVTCAPQATATNDADTGVGHLMALRPSLRDLSIDMVRDVPLTLGGTANYTLTVNNEGSLAEPGPISIVNTLPTGLSLASYSGSGWSCSTAGQVVTCTKTLTSPGLAAGASATPLVLKVNVSGTATGVITNTATVSGTGGDGNSSNDTATDTYVILPTPYAYYKLDEAVGVTSFANASGGSASALGSATATGNPPATVGAALSGNPGTCGAVRVPAGTTGIGINTAIDVNTIGNTGAIAFWYASSAAWNDGNSRMLFDASADLGTNAQDRLFLLAKDGTGKLVFSLEDSAGATSTATSPSYNFAANTWHHIAVTWNAAGSIKIYLDGDSSPIATSSTALNGTLGNVATLYMGAQRMTGVGGAPAAYTTNSANGYLDEVRIYNRVLADLEVAAVADLTHACAATVDHFELSMPTTASACSPVVVTVTACADTSSPCTNPQAVASGLTANLSTVGGTITSPVTFGTLGIANTNLNYLGAATGATSVVTLSGEQLPSGQSSVLNPRKCCPDGVSCVVRNTCTTTFTACSAAAAGFNVVDSNYADKGYDAASDHRIYTKLAGWNEVTGVAGNTTIRLDVVALSSGGTTETNYVGSGGSSKDVKVELFDDSSGTACNSSAANCAACSKTVVATVNPVTFSSSNAGYQNDVTFSLGNTNAYSRLIARVTDTNAASTVYGCSTDAFAVRPRSLAVTATTSGGTALSASSGGATATPTVAAGANFTMHADTATSGYGGTPKLNVSAVTDFLLVPAATGLLTGSFGAANAAGKASGTNFKYDEVGYFVMAADAVYDDDWVKNGSSGDWAGGDCLTGSTSNAKSGGKYGCNIGSSSTSWGRFIPAYFDTVVTPADGTFTYSGQPFTVTVTAKSASGAVTKNFAGSYARDVTLSDANSATNSSNTLGGFTNGTILAANFTAGAATTNTVTYTFTAKETAPLEVRTGSNPIQIHAATTETSGAGYSPTEGTTAIRSGRLRLSNAFGSEKSALQMTVQAQYWGGSSWVLNSADSTTSLPASAFALSGTMASKTSASAVTLAGGTGTLTLANPNPGSPASLATGSVDVAIDLGASGVDQSCLATHGGTPAGLPWLRSQNGSCAATFDRDPSARATFGVYSPETRKTVHVRELY